MSTRTPSPASGRYPHFKDHPIAALAVICLSVFVISVDATIVNVALPTLSRELGANTAQLQWIVDAYTLVIRRTAARGRQPRRPLRPHAAC